MPTYDIRPTTSPVSASSCIETRNTVNLGYYSSWADTRWCNQIQPDEVDVQKFGYTHLVYAFGGISEEGEIESFYGNTLEYAEFQKFNSLKNDNPELKTLLAIGGWNFDQTRFSSVSSSPSRRRKFAKSVVVFLETHGFDGVDLDWEYPVTRMGVPEDYGNYPKLCRAIMEEFQRSGHEDYILSVATSISVQHLQDGFDLVEMAPWVSFFNVMSYDIYGSWHDVAGALAGLDYISNTFDYMLGLGVNPSKFVLGLAAYGRSTKLVDSNCTTAGCPIDGAGMTGCLGEPGVIPTFELMDFMETGNYLSLVKNNETDTMEMVNEIDGDIFFTSFDSEETFNIKYQYAFTNCLRGIMWWAVDLINEPFVFDEGPWPTSSPSSSMGPSSSSRPSYMPSTSAIPSVSFSPTKMITLSPSLPPTEPCSSCPVNATGYYPNFDCTGFMSCHEGVLIGKLVSTLRVSFTSNQICLSLTNNIL